MKTLVLGASTNKTRYAYQAIKFLKSKKIEAIPMGIKKGSIIGIDIINDRPDFEDIHTVTLYVNPQIQKDYYTYILSLKPKRIIFNPGTENPEFYRLIKQADSEIKIEVACTLVMLKVGAY